MWCHFYVHPYVTVTVCVCIRVRLACFHGNVVFVADLRSLLHISLNVRVHRVKRMRIFFGVKKMGVMTGYFLKSCIMGFCLFVLIH